jgi:protein-L-isoaspartate(D-aspartate) O-methyltransferase
MVQEQLMARGIRDEAILGAMLQIPRHLFIEAGLEPMAYNDHPLSIGLKQTISQPYIVAYMLEALQLKKTDRVLEIGTGSGYQTALLAELVHHVYSIERLPDLLFKARHILKKLCYKNITLKLGDGTKGWPEKAPFDAIVVSAGSPQIPKPYFEQLSEGGRMILPVGAETYQELTLVTKRAGRQTVQTLSGCRFVKLKGEYGFRPT